MTGDLWPWADRITALVNGVDDAIRDNPDTDQQYLYERFTGALELLADEMRAAAMCVIPGWTRYEPVNDDERS